MIIAVLKIPYVERVWYRKNPQFFVRLMELNLTGRVPEAVTITGAVTLAYSDFPKQCKYLLRWSMNDIGEPTSKNFGRF